MARKLTLLVANGEDGFRNFIATIMPLSNGAFSRPPEKLAVVSVTRPPADSPATLIGDK